MPRRHVLANKNAVYLINLVMGKGKEVLGREFCEVQAKGNMVRDSENGWGELWSRLFRDIPF